MAEMNGQIRRWAARTGTPDVWPDRTRWAGALANARKNGSVFFPDAVASPTARVPPFCRLQVSVERAHTERYFEGMASGSPRPSPLVVLLTVVVGLAACAVFAGIIVPVLLGRYADAVLVAGCVALIGSLGGLWLVLRRRDGSLL